MQEAEAPTVHPVQTAEVIPSTAPPSPGAHVVVGPSETTQLREFVEKTADTADSISRKARRIVRRNMYVLDSIIANPLEEARDRIRAFETLAKVGRVHDQAPKDKSKVVVVRVMTADAAVEVRTEQ